MTIDLIMIGKTDSELISGLTSEYQKRINHYIKFSQVILPDLRNTKGITQAVQKQKEGESILKQVGDGDHLVLLDEKGSQCDSVQFAGWIQKRLNSGVKKVVFVIGGPYGFSGDVYSRADGLLSLSKMTFSHQLVRPIFAEQLYRAFTILRNEPYHHR